jgi:hypothetical protein
VEIINARKSPRFFSCSAAKRGLRQKRGGAGIEQGGLCGRRHACRSHSRSQATTAPGSPSRTSEFVPREFKRHWCPFVTLREQTASSTLGNHENEPQSYLDGKKWEPPKQPRKTYEQPHLQTARRRPLAAFNSNQELEQTSRAVPEPGPAEPS